MAAYEDNFMYVGMRRNGIGAFLVQHRLNQPLSESQRPRVCRIYTKGILVGECCHSARTKWQHPQTKKTTIGRLFCKLVLAEGTGFEPADTLRYRQFSKLLV